jgi:hypothetical protein
MRVVCAHVVRSTASAVQASACRVLVRTVTEAERRTKAVQAGLMECVLAALKAHANDVSVQERGCWALCRLLTDAPAHKARAASAGAAPLLLAALRQHAGDAEVAENALLALSALSGDAGGVTRICAANGIADVAAAMARRPSAPLIQRSCSNLLINCTVNDPARKQQAADAGAVEAAIAVLGVAAHAEDDELQSRNCRLLSVLCGEAAIASRAIDARGLEALLAAATRLTGAATRGSAAAAEGLAYTLLAFSRMVANNPAGKQRAGALGVVAAVLAGMRVRAGGDTVQLELCENGALALSALSSEPANAERARAADAFPVLVAAMTAHARSVTLQVAACTSLMRISEAGNAARASGATAGAIEAVLATLHAHPGAADVQEKGCVALARLVESSPTNKARAGAAAVTTVLAAARAHPKQHEVVENAFMAASLLVGDDTVARGVPMDATLQAVVAAVKAQPASPGVQQYGAVVFATLTWNNTPAKTAAGAAGGVEALIAALRAHGRERRYATQHCMQALGIVLGLDANVARAVKGGAVDAVNTAIKSHPAVPDIQADGFKSLLALCAVADARTQAMRGGAPALAAAAVAAFPANADVTAMAKQLCAKLGC